MESYTTQEQNFFILIQALKHSTVGLKTYVDQCFEDLYDRLKRKVGANGACTQCCSKQFTVTRWCNTCAAWKREVENLMRYNKHKNKVNWLDIELWKLSGTDYEAAKVELCRIFARDARQFKFDICNMLSLLQNCRYFKIGDDKKRVEEFRNVRNNYFAHTVAYEMSRKQLEKAISSILRFFQHVSFKGFICISTTLIDIQGLLTKNKNSLAKLEVYSVFKNLRQISEVDINEFLSINEDKHGPDRQHKNVKILALFVAIFSALLVMINTQLIPIMNGTSELACKDATYEHPFTMDIDLDFYRSQHDNLVGREWLLNELDEKMFFSKRGVLLLAEMGYGKSAIVAHLICQSDKRFPGNWIYEHIVVYHICHFYSRKTLFPGNFVKNLAGGLSKRIAGFLQVLQKNSRFKTYFEGDGCEEDPEGCLDVLVLKALNDLDMVNNTYIVVIDALDECIEHGNRNIFNLLWKRLPDFPKNIKFFLTSRNTSDIRIARSQLLVIEKRPTDNSNTKDAHLILNSTLTKLSPFERNNLKRIFKTGEIATAISKAVKYTKGNILLLTNGLIGWLQNDVSLRGSYTTFEVLFDDQLKRIFHDRDLFKTVIKVFQVLCSTVEPLYVEELLAIANLDDDEIVDVLSIIGKELSHFIRQANGKISLVHKSLAAYLTDNTRKTEQFYVSKRNGCRLYAKYLLNLLRQQRSFTNISIVDLASYAACSSDKKIKYEFLQNSKKHISDFSNVYILHQAAAKLNSYTAMSLLLDLFSLRSVDETDKGNITASYVAAAFGNHRSLGALLDRNANVNFTRLGPKFINETVDMLKFCKTYAFWEYNLLNIAAQNGHIETVLTLLRHNVNVSHQTSFGSNSFLLAIENGYTSIVQEFLLRFKHIFITSLNQALYLSAKHGYVDIVDLLLYHGAEDSCLSCNSSQYWASFHETRLQTIKTGEALQRFNYLFIDDYRFIRCETALEIAIQNGHIEVVKRLLKRSNNTLHCREAGGRTPAFTAIKYKRSEIFKILLDEGINKLERSLYQKDREEAIDLNDTERKEYLQNLCLYNITLSHFLAYYWEKELFDLGKNYNIWNWLAKDVNGSTPVHFACCAGNIEMIYLLDKDESWFDLRSINGSTPKHSAAICRQSKLLSHLLSRYPKSVFDNQHRSISHYVAMSVRFNDETTEEIINNEEYSYPYLKNKLYEEVYLEDKYNKSPLHYLCENGNVNLFNFYNNILSNATRFNTKVIALLDSAFSSTPVLYKNDVKIVDFCNVHLFSSDMSCEAQRLKIFLPHEYLIYVIFKSVYMHKSVNIAYYNVEKYVNISLQKNSAHMLGMLFHNFRYEYTQYMYRNGINSLLNLYKHPQINPEIFLYLPKMRYDCSKLTGEAVLHDIVQDKKGTFWTSIYFDFSVFEVFPKSLDLCLDKNGYNFLHRSVIGGNVKAFIFLRMHGMSCSMLTGDGRNLLQLLVDNAPCFEEKNGNIYKHRYNAIASYLATETRVLNDMPLQEICDPASKSLGFSHKAAAKGFIDVLLTIEKQFGSHAFNCLNKNNITTAFLILFFNHFDEFLFLRPGYMLPNPHFITSLFLKILLDFKPFVFPKFSVETKCNYRIRNHRNTRDMGICVLNLEKEFFSLIQQYVKISGVKSKEDLEELLSKTHPYQSKGQDDACSNDFGKVLANIQNLNENPKTYLNLRCYIYDNILKRLKRNGCLNSSLSQNTNSTYCCELISLITKLNKLFKDLYYIIKSKKMFLLFSLYQNQLSIPFEHNNQHLTKDGWVKYAALYFERAQLITSVKPAFHMQKKYDFWNWFKSCKNYNAMEMIRQISFSTVREIQQWKGSTKNYLLSVVKNPTYTFTSEDAKMPLKEYNFHEDADAI